MREQLGQPPQEPFAKSYFKEYCHSTSIHGFRYFGEKRTIFEKIWWIIMFTICLTICVLAVMAVYQKWSKSPIIITLATKSTPIYEIPFPAVTVCSEAKIKSEVFNYTDVVWRKRKGLNLSDEEETMLSQVDASVCKPKSKLEYKYIFEDKDFVDVIEKVTPDFYPINCEYMALEADCAKIFVPIITDEGICYTFNMLDRHDLFSDVVAHYKDYHNSNQSSRNWSVDHGYGEDADKRTYPKRALLAGTRYALKFELKSTKGENDNSCRGSVQGYKVQFHLPARFPMASQGYLSLPLNKAMVAAISPTSIITSDAVKAYPHQKRGCYFSSEKKLKFFKIYTLYNCKLECITNFTLSFCGCVNFYMPREKGARICDAASLDCVFGAEHMMQNVNLERKLGQISSTASFLLSHEQVSCDCLPLCTDIVYTVGVSQTDWDWTREVETISQKEMNRTASAPAADSYDLSKFSAYFGTEDFIGSERNELYGSLDFLANFGGVLGLFTGFSILSLIELVYFLTIRLICNYCGNKDVMIMTKE